MSEMKALYTKIQELCETCSSEGICGWSEYGCEGCRMKIKHGEQWVTVDPVKKRILSVTKGQGKKEFEYV